MKDSEMTDQNRIIGRLEAQVASAEERLERIEVKMDALMEYAAQAKGGWRLILAVGAAGSAIGVSITKLVAMLKGGMS